MVTFSTLADSTSDMKSLKATARSWVWNLVEKFHTRTPTTTSTIQNSRLFSVEFTPDLPAFSSLRLPRLPFGR